MDPNVHDVAYNTPLHYTAQRGLFDLGQYLIQICQNPYSVNIDGQVAWEQVSDQNQVHLYQVCVVCKNLGVQACKNCMVVYYCGVDCQKKDFASHQKKWCQQLAQRDQYARMRKQSQGCSSLSHHHGQLNLQLPRQDRENASRSSYASWQPTTRQGSQCDKNSDIFQTGDKLHSTKGSFNMLQGDTRCHTYTNQDSLDNLAQPSSKLGGNPSKQK